MDCAVMQPYLFPYLGYFQKMNMVDIFVVSDNVQYIKRGWINRNRILVNNKEYMITFPVVKDSSKTEINKRYFVDDSHARKKILKTVHQNYQNAPHFKECYEILEMIIHYNNNNVLDYIMNSFELICAYIDIHTSILLESELEIPRDLNAEDTVIYICKILNADRYINAIGGIELYSAQKFRENDITLKFIKVKESVRYNQLNNFFVPNLSIIDVMMFNSKKEITKLLSEYKLIDGIY